MYVVWMSGERHGDVVGAVDSCLFLFAFPFSCVPIDHHPSHMAMVRVCAWIPRGQELLPLSCRGRGLSINLT